MKAIYNNSTIPEREAKIRYHFPENIMMENAAAALEKLVLDLTEQMGLDSDLKVLIVCGSGNNGGGRLCPCPSSLWPCKGFCNCNCRT